MFDNPLPIPAGTKVLEDEDETWEIAYSGSPDTSTAVVHHYECELMQCTSDNPEDTFLWELVYKVEVIDGVPKLFESSIQITDGDSYELSKVHAKAVAKLKELCEQNGIEFVPAPDEQERSTVHVLRQQYRAVSSLRSWAEQAGETLEWYCAKTRDQSTDERNRGKAAKVMAAALYREVVNRNDYHRCYDACCRSVDELEDEDPKMWQAAKNAIEVQDACNLTGVMYSFLREISFLLERDDVGDPRDHYVVVLYADKICDLTGVKTQEAAQEALACE